MPPAHRRAAAVRLRTASGGKERARGQRKVGVCLSLEVPREFPSPPKARDRPRRVGTRTPRRMRAPFPPRVLRIVGIICQEGKLPDPSRSRSRHTVLGTRHTAPVTRYMAHSTAPGARHPVHGTRRPAPAHRPRRALLLSHTLPRTPCTIIVQPCSTQDIPPPRVVLHMRFHPFRPSSPRPARADCPFCVGPTAGKGPLCNICRAQGGA